MGYADEVRQADGEVCSALDTMDSAPVNEFGPMLIYLDNCCFNRPFDDQAQLRIWLETQAKLDIQHRIQEGKLQLAWSYILDYENQANPFPERRQAISRWKRRAVIDVSATPELLGHALSIAQEGIRPKDALHIACAVVAGCTFFVTTDDGVLRKAQSLHMIRVVSPVQFVMEVQ